MASSSSSVGTLERGKACLRCRRRKMRCDGAHPACGQCTNAGRDMDCEYAEGKEPTTSQILEEQVSQLQLRIAQLESVNAAPLALFDPYESFRRSQGAGALPSQQRNQTLHTLLRGFFHNASSYGFFLHISRFLQQVASPPSTGYPSHVTLLLNAIYLAGAQSSPDAQIRAEQPEFLSTVLNLLTPSLSGGVHNTATMYVLQTEIILTYCFFASNRGMEAIYHFRAATSIVFACGLHRIRSSRPHPGGSASGVQYQLNAPADSLEEGERINAFWQVLILDKCSSVTMAAPSAFSEDEATGTIVDSPWPMEVGAYLSNPLPSGARGARTIQTYMQSLGSPQHGQQNYLATQAKAAILYAYAYEVAQAYNPNDRNSMTRFTYLDRGIPQLAHDLPPIENVDPSRPDVLRKLVMIHILVHCAVLQLHKPLEQPAVMYQGKSWNAAQSAVAVLQRINIGAITNMEPGVAYLLVVVADVLMRGIMTLRSQNAIDMSNQTGLLAPLSQILSAMDWWSTTSPLFSAFDPSRYVKLEINPPRGQQRAIVQNMLAQI